MLMLLLGFVLGAGMGIVALYARDAGYRDGLEHGIELGMSAREWMDGGDADDHGRTEEGGEVE